MKHLATIVLTAALATFSACGTTKGVAQNTAANSPQGTTATTGKQAQQTIASTFADWNTMQCGGTFRMGGTKSFSSSIQVRMERDKYISISLRPLLGIELGRLIFTGDSVYVIDKVHRRYIAENVSMFTNGLPATVSTLQDIFMGRAFILGEGTYGKSRMAKATVDDKDGVTTLTPVKQPNGFNYVFTFDDVCRILALQVVPDGAQSTVYSVDYKDVKSTNAGNIAHNVSIAGSIKGKELSMQLDFNDITWNKSIKADVSIPTSYKKVDITHINTLLNVDE